MKTKRLVTILIPALGLLLMAAVILGVETLSGPAPGTKQDPQARDEAVEMSGGDVKGPFVLRVTYPKVGGQQYVSFNVYYRHDGAEELWYACGRMFSAAQTQSVGWADDLYNIAVTMKDGRRELFAYDGNNQWQ